MRYSLTTMVPHQGRPASKWIVSMMDCSMPEGQAWPRPREWNEGSTASVKESGERPVSIDRPEEASGGGTERSKGEEGDGGVLKKRVEDKSVSRGRIEEDRRRSKQDILKEF